MLIMCADGRLLKSEFSMRYVGTEVSRKSRHIRSEILDLDKANVGHLHLHPILHGYSTESCHIDLLTVNQIPNRNILIELLHALSAC